jgi:hypothetical protein
MSILQSASVLHSSQNQNSSAKKATTAEDEDSRKPKSVAGKSEGTVLSPLSPLIRLIRDPVGAVASVVEGLRDQAGAEERNEKLRIEGRRQILCARLKNV